MRHDYRFALALHQEHARELRQAAAAHRLARLHARSASRRAGFRQHVGRSLVHLGSRVAADPSLAPARSP